MNKIFLSILLGFIFSLIASPIVIHLMKKLKANQTIYEYVDMHNCKKGTPTMGGIIFILGTFLAFLCVKNGSYLLSRVCLVCFLCFGILGFLDDFLKIYNKRNLGLKPYQKIIGQVAISIIIAVFAYRNPYIGSEILIPFTNKIIDLGWFYIPFCIFIFLATTNAVNLTDGLDGLAGGVSLSYFFGFIFIEYILFSSTSFFDSTLLSENLNLFILCGSIMGSLLAYLVRNCYPASIFMGDTGSLALGGLVASMMVCTKQVLLIPILGFMFVVSCVSVIIQVVYFHFTKKRIFLMAPYHHHLEKKGMNETKIVTIYIIITIFISILSAFITIMINL